jgi:PPM family protein phosphatase
MKLNFSYRTDIGCVRDKNEDSVLVEPEQGLFVVADGMGGHRAGEVASEMACQIIKKSLQENIGSKTSAEQLLKSAVAEANQAIHAKSSSEPEHEGMGTTIDVLWFDQEEQAHWAHVGDSRIYRQRDGHLKQLTEDHSLLNHYLKTGVLTPEEAHQNPIRHVILQALGTAEAVDIQTGAVDVETGDLFLLCSDGLTDVLRDPEIVEIIARGKDLEQVAEQAIEAVKEKGGPDNISAIWIEVGGKK